MSQEKLGRNALCPCGSGKKFKRCCARPEKKKKEASHEAKRVLTWVGGGAVVLLIGYGISKTGPLGGASTRRTPGGGFQRIGYYTDADIEEIDFSGLTEKQKKKVLDKANKAQCTCGCGMTLAECVAIDSTCPLRSSNIQEFSDMVKKEISPS